jgi:hypothetical protein
MDRCLSNPHANTHTIPVNCTLVFCIAHRPQGSNKTRRLFCSRHMAGKYGFLQDARLPGMTLCRRVVLDVSEGHNAFIFKGRQRQHTRPDSGAAEECILRDMTLCRGVSGRSDSIFKGALPLGQFTTEAVATCLRQGTDHTP